ncbi:MAG TPA: GNAT family N-acetyltransferase [Frankiaceae bacterium]|nr:GNAT family N-acetyltransferase [Frankiaceae bacterium]
MDQQLTGAAGDELGHPEGQGFVDVVLRDGSTARLRTLHPSDGPALLQLHRSLSPDSTYLRFFTASRNSGDLYVERLIRPQTQQHAGLVLMHHGRLVGVASYEGVPDPVAGEVPSAEIAFAVADDEHGLGVGTLLLEHLASRARARGITRFVAEVLPRNQRMVDVFRDAGFGVDRSFGDDTVRFDLDLTPGPGLLDALDRRDREAEIAGLNRLFRPRSVAVVGASDRPHVVGTAILRNLVRGGFSGRIHPVNARHDVVQGLRAWRSVRELPHGVDLIIVAVPAEQVLTVAADCADLGAGAMVVVSAGFADDGPEGRDRQRRLLDLVAAAGMRLVGPNCLGIIDTAGALSASFAPRVPGRGPIGVLTQSGGLGIALLEHLSAAGLGISSFASVGNKADVSGNDLLRWWEQDAETRVAVLYLESFGNPRRFAGLARQLSASIPVVAIKAGRSGAGARAASSHTAAAATPTRSVEALFRQAGVIAVPHMGELLDVVTLLATQPLPRGDRLAVIGNAGGPNILAADTVAELGLQLPELAPETQRRLRDCLPSGAAVVNPVDTIAGASGQQFESGVRAVLADQQVDAVLAILTPTPLTEPDELLAAVHRAADGSAKPVLISVIGSTSITTVAAPENAVHGHPTSGGGLPRYAYPEAAVLAFQRVAGYGEFRRRARGRLPRPATGAPAARRLVDAYLERSPDGGWLSPNSVQELLAAYQIPMPPASEVTSAAAAGEAARRLGTPAALKAVGPGLVHKTDVGGVVLDLPGPAAVSRAFRDMKQKLGDSMTGALVQPMAPEGVEVVAGVSNEPTFGPLLMFGMGGVLTDLLDERTFRLLPLTNVDAAELIRSGRGARLLSGYRGSDPCDLLALEQLLVRLGQLAGDLPEVVELDLNPIRAYQRGALVLDAKIRVTPAPQLADVYARRLH